MKAIDNFIFGILSFLGMMMPEQPVEQDERRFRKGYLTKYLEKSNSPKVTEHIKNRIEEISEEIA